MKIFVLIDLFRFYFGEVEIHIIHSFNYYTTILIKIVFNRVFMKRTLSKVINFKLGHLCAINVNVSTK